MQWNYKAHGVDLVMSGHAHQYELLRKEKVIYVVNGLGGAVNLHSFDTALDLDSKGHYPPVYYPDDPDDPSNPYFDDRGAMKLRISVSPSGAGRLTTSMYVVDTKVADPPIPPNPRFIGGSGKVKQCGVPTSSPVPGEYPWPEETYDFATEAEVDAFHSEG